jgi:PAS domain S-box-containing protein
MDVGGIADRMATEAAMDFPLRTMQIQDPAMSDDAEIAHTLTVLVVDDTATNRQILQAFLIRLGYAVILAENGSQAIDRFAEARPDIVLMDVMMPIIDGFEATRRIKALSGERWVPVVYLTALDKESDLVTGLDAGGDDYLTKPISFVVLDAKLRSLTRTLTLQRTLAETRRRTQAVTDNIMDGVINIDESGRMKFCNPAVARMFGYSLDELIGQNVTLLMAEPQRSAHNKSLRSYLDGGLPHVIGLTRQLIGLHKDGRPIPLELSVSEFSIGSERHFVGILRDISQRLAAEAQLRESAERLQRYFDRQEEENILAKAIMRRLTLREGTQDRQLQHWMRPAANFSGDILVAARSPENRLYAMLGDATGHGLAAAISALPAVSVFYGMVKRNLPLSVIVSELNKHLRDTLPAGRFFAASLFCGDARARCAELWVGGMPAVIEVDETGTVRRTFPSRQLALGIADVSAEMCATESVTWAPGHQFVLYSDGLTEAVDGEGREFGTEGLTAQLAAAPAHGRLEAIRAAIGRHVGTGETGDDISLLLIAC